MNGIRWSVLQNSQNFYSIDFLRFFAKRNKSAEKMTHRKKNKDYPTSKIVKSKQSYSNGHLPYYCSLYYSFNSARARCMTWRVNFVRSKDAQKQLSANVLNRIDVTLLHH